MSTNYRPLTTIQMSDLFDGRLERFNVHEHQTESTSPTNRCLTDGFNYVWVDCEDGSVSCLTRYARAGNPHRILACIAEAFSADIISEHDPEFWGFDSQEAWDASQHRIHQEYEDQYYAELLKFLAGESCDITPGTIGMIKAEIAKQLVAQNPELALPANRTRLSAEMDEIYGPSHEVVVQLHPSEIAALDAAWKRAEEIPTLEAMWKTQTPPARR